LIIYPKFSSLTSAGVQVCPKEDEGEPNEAVSTVKVRGAL